MKKTLLYKLLTLFAFSACNHPAADQNADTLYQLAQEDFPRFSQAISGEGQNDFERTQNIVTWLARHFDWKYTDYKKRTVPEIIERKGGNCNELAKVSKACMDELDIKYRTVREINLHVNTPRRQQTAEEKVAAAGNRMSVFGQRHNDHVWIEVYDPKTDRWFPADPSMGAVGEKEWLAARYGFGERFTLNPTSEDMIAPFAILVFDQDLRLLENRSEHYAIDGFNELYEGRLSDLSSWAKWTAGIRSLSDKAAAAFRGELNLHEHGEEIRELWETYYALKAEYAEKYGTDSEKSLSVGR